MKKIVVAAVIAIWCVPSATLAGERVGDAALGALSGAVVLGPIGAVWAFHWIERLSRANKPSVPKRVTCDINYLLEKSGFGDTSNPLLQWHTETKCGM